MGFGFITEIVILMRPFKITVFSIFFDLNDEKKLSLSYISVKEVKRKQ